MNEVIFLPPARNFLKKLKDKNLKKLFEDAIKNIAENPEVGQVKTGDLSGIYAYADFNEKMQNIFREKFVEFAAEFGVQNSTNS